MQLSLADVLSDNATRHRDVAAYVADGRTITHGDLYRRAHEIAGALNAHGVRRQDRVAILGRNSIAFGEVLAAGQLAGIVVATVNFRFAAPEIAHVLTDCAPRVIFVDAEYLALVQTVRPTGVELIVCLDAPGAGDVVGLDDFTAHGGDLLDRATPEDVACLIYTSGTTGRPKGCILGQHEMRSGALQLNAEMRTGSSDSVLLVMPIFHIGAMAIGLGLHARGGTAVLHRQFEPAAALETIAAERVGVLHLAPVLLSQLLTAAADRPDALTGVETVVYSAAPMTQAILGRALAAMPDAGFLNLYGQTETFTSGLAREYHRHVSTPADLRRLTSVGHPFPGNTVRVVDDAGAEVAVGSPGEITVRSPSTFRGYWNNSAATAAALADGWCHTGDVGLVDAEGLIHLVDRVKDVIITGGENVYSVEVEDALSTHPAIVESAVVGVPDERWGETVCAVVVPVEGTAPTLEDLQAHVAETLSRYKVPRLLVLATELPRMPTGKIDKKSIRAETRGADQCHAPR